MSGSQQEEILAKLKAGSEMKDVDFSHCQLWTRLREQPRQIGEVLRQSVASDISLAGNHLGVAATSELLQALAGARHLGILNLGSNDLTSGIVPQLMDFIERTPSVKAIALFGNALDHTTTAAIRAALNTPRAQLPEETQPPSGSGASTRSTRETAKRTTGKKSTSSRKPKSSKSTSSSKEGGGSKEAGAGKEGEGKDVESLKAQLDRAQVVERELRNKIASLEGAIQIQSKASMSDGVPVLSLRFENIVVTERLAATGGSNACVYACYVNGWQCAIKELQKPTGFLSDQSSMEGFLREITLIENLPPHKNIVRYLHHEETPTHIRLYMTRYAGSLGSEIRKFSREMKQFSPGQIAYMACDIAKGIEFLHSHGIIHRDLKSDNVFVLKNETGGIQTLVIGDFDTAKKISGNQLAMTVIGTPAFIAPEVLECDDAYTFSADIFSLGMVIYEMIALRLPFDDVPVMRIASRSMAGDRPSIPDRVDKVAYAPLIQMFLRCTSLKPADRPSLTTIRSELAIHMS
ncbi:MAG: serine/threonine-protein kinase [archaeon]|nr:serine/threonine-protein kinase [archaeon]